MVNTPKIEQNTASTVRHLAVYFASQLTSHQVVTGFPEQRLAYLSQRIVSANAQTCAVLRPESFILLGLIRFSDVAANPDTATRILADLMDPPPPYKVRDSDPVEAVVELLVENDPLHLVVEKASGAFAGLITPESFARWLLAISPAPEFALSRLPAHSRWNPYSQSFEVLTSDVG